LAQTAPKVRTKTVSEVRNVAVSFSGKLDSGELLTGTPVVTELTTSALTFSNEVVSTAILSIDDIDVPIGEAVQFKVTGGLAGIDYTIQISSGTDSSPAQTLRGRVPLYVEAD